FGFTQLQGAGEGGENLPRRAGTARLLQTGAVVDGNGRQVGDLLSSEARGASSMTCRQPHVGWLEPQSTGSAEVGEWRAGHSRRTPPQLLTRQGGGGGPSITVSTGPSSASCSLAAYWRHSSRGALDVRCLEHGSQQANRLRHGAPAGTPKDE